MPKKTTAKKAAKKATKKTATKKTSVKKVAAKKAPSKKVAVKKAGVKKTAAKKVVKKVAAKKASKKVAVKKSARKSKDATVIVARVDVGFGNSLFVRGHGGGGLSWDKGIELENVGPFEWTFATDDVKDDITYKLLINDSLWAEGENETVKKGEHSETTPAFNWQ